MLAAAKRLLALGPELLFTNNVVVATMSPATTVVNGRVSRSMTPTAAWSGLGSLQYVRPRIQKPFADEEAGTHEDPVAFVAYLPFEAAPGKIHFIQDVDGVLGAAGRYYPQSREPANVGGLSVYWECYLGVAVNAR